VADDGVEAPEVRARRRDGAGVLDDRGDPGGRVTVTGDVEGHDREVLSDERLGEAGELRAAALPAVDEEDDVRTGAPAPGGKRLTVVGDGEALGAGERVLFPCGSGVAAGGQEEALGGGRCEGRGVRRQHTEAGTSGSYGEGHGVPSGAAGSFGTRTIGRAGEGPAAGVGRGTNVRAIYGTSGGHGFLGVQDAQASVRMRSKAVRARFSARAGSPIRRR
jgi:hypothetical protein